MLWMALLACESGTVTINGEPEGTPADENEGQDATNPEASDPEESDPVDQDPDGESPPDEAEDYGDEGPFSVTAGTGSVTVNGCSMSYTTFTPQGVSPDNAVVLTHGFMRGPENMEGWAIHLASWGVPVVTPKLCHATALDSDHPQNGEDLIALSEYLGISPLYIGHSAGGLASVLAADGDPNALGIFGLDLVDSGNLGANTSVMSFGVLGDSGACNSQNNAVSVYDVGLRVAGASHCSFESPTDWACTTFCGGDGGNGQHSLDEIHTALRRLMTSFALWKTDIDPLAEQYWQPGTTWNDTLVATGLLTEI